MSKRKAATERASSPAEPSPEPALPTWSKYVLSALLAFHIAAVVIGPLRFVCRSSSGPSPFVEAVATLFQPYTSAMYLNHGYAFFAPDPGPNHLVDYKVEFTGGAPPIEGRFPNLAMERPRLLYHRHFMLAESLVNRFAPPEFVPEPSPPSLTAPLDERARYEVMRADYKRDRAEWEHARRQYEALRKSVEEHLQHAHGGDRVTLARIEHRPASPLEVQSGRRLDAADSYRVLPEVPSRGDSR